MNFLRSAHASPLFLSSMRLDHCTKQVRKVCTTYRSIVYNEFGDPSEVLKLVSNALPSRKLNSTEVLLKVLMAPVNPADINMIQGTYAVKPPLPAIAGNEGISEVIEIGSDVKDLKMGSWVIHKVPAVPGAGMWTELMHCESKNLFEVPNDLPAISAATMSVNPCTAYRMLKDFVKLEKNDTVIQNAANSGVGTAVIQIAKQLGLNTVNLIRSRDNEEELIKHLEELGATYVVTDQKLKDNYLKDIFSKIPKAKLALNAVGGKSTIDLCKYMEKFSTMVTYGGMSRQPLMVPVGSLIFNDFKIKGYWMTRWVKENYDNPERSTMMNYIYDLIRNKHLLPPRVSYHLLENYQLAVKTAMEPFSDSKQVIVFDDKYMK